MSDATVFLKYCCPECDFKNDNFDDFSGHALENHVLAKTLFLKYQNTNTNIDTNIKVEPSYDLIEDDNEDIKPTQYEDYSGEIDYFNNDSTDVKNGEFNFQAWYINAFAIIDFTFYILVWHSNKLAVLDYPI